MLMQTYQARSSAVNLAPVTDADHEHEEFGIVDVVHHAVVAHTNAPELRVCKLLTSSRARIFLQGLDASDDALSD